MLFYSANAPDSKKDMKRVLKHIHIIFLVCLANITACFKHCFIVLKSIKYLKMVSLIYFIVSEINIFTKFR